MWLGVADGSWRMNGKPKFFFSSIGQHPSNPRIIVHDAGKQETETLQRDYKRFNFDISIASRLMDVLFSDFLQSNNVSIKIFDRD